MLKAGFLKERVDSMSEPDFLSRKIGELKDWQTVAWRRIADPSVTRFERREIRNHIKQSGRSVASIFGDDVRAGPLPRARCGRRRRHLHKT